MITCYWGSLGAGKTFSMVDNIRREVTRKKSQVYTDMRSLLVPEQSYLDLENIEEIAYVEDGILALDELQIGLASARWQKVSDEALKAMAQFRKNGLEVVYTTQHPDRVNKVMRENTHNWVRCRKVGPVVVQTWKDTPTDRKGRIKVVPFRLSSCALYDTLEVLGEKPKRKLARSGPLAAARSRDSGENGRSAPRAPWERPIWHVEEGRHVLTVDAREVLADLKAAGVVRDASSTGTATYHWERLVEEETRRRRWLAMFGLLAGDVGNTCRIEHPWTYEGCPCCVPPNIVAPRSAVPERDFAFLNLRTERSGEFKKAKARQLVERGGEIAADRLGLFQVKAK